MEESSTNSSLHPLKDSIPLPDSTNAKHDTAVLKLINNNKSEDVRHHLHESLGWGGDDKLDGASCLKKGIQQRRRVTDNTRVFSWKVSFLLGLINEHYLGRTLWAFYSPRWHLWERNKPRRESVQATTRVNVQDVGGRTISADEASLALVRD